MYVFDFIWQQFHADWPWHCATTQVVNNVCDERKSTVLHCHTTKIVTCQSSDMKQQDTSTNISGHPLCYSNFSMS